MTEAAGRKVLTVRLVSSIIAVVVPIADQGVGDTLRVAAPESFLGVEAGSGQRTGVG